MTSDSSNASPTGDSVETVRRLAPTPETLRQLYLLSGNECAFPGCRASIIGAGGDFIGQICHIEAAMPGGERFNSAMTNEQRRAASNLLLMCYRHHVETDDVNAYPVERLRQIKAEHEARYSEGMRHLIDSVVDWTETSEFTPPSTLRAFNAHFGWSTSDAEEIEGNVAAAVEVAEQLRALSLPARETLALLVRRGRAVSRNNLDVGYALLLQEIEDVTGMSPHEVLARVGQLSERNLARIELEDWQFDEFTGPFAVAVGITDYPSYSQIRSYCEANGIAIAEILVELRFDLLDEPPV
jgi:hypothetical protein